LLAFGLALSASLFTAAPVLGAEPDQPAHARGRRGAGAPGRTEPAGGRGRPARRQALRPRPDTISKQAQEYLKSLHDPGTKPAVPAADDVTRWRRRWEAREGESTPLAEATLRRYGATVVERQLGGVLVLDIKPKGWRDSGKLLVYTHGGAYTFFSARSALPSAVVAADATGLRVISVDYTMAPADKWDRVTDKVVAVITPIQREGGRLRDMAIYGDSAGGGLVPGAVL
jgi:epsilon-lactone hydrolase